MREAPETIHRRDHRGRGEKRQQEEEFRQDNRMKRIQN
jgi:hypothetical protein